MSEETDYFLRYAFPCAHVLCDMGRMTEEDYERMQSLAKHGGDVSFDELERLFPAAFKRIREVAEKTGKSPYSLEVIRRYFLHDHQDYIDKGDGMYGEMPETFCDFCKVKVLEVLDKKWKGDELFLRVGEWRWVRAPFFDDVEIGGKVTVHHAFAVEKVN